MRASSCCSCFRRPTSSRAAPQASSLRRRRCCSSASWSSEACCAASASSLRSCARRSCKPRHPVFPEGWCRASYCAALYVLNPVVQYCFDNLRGNLAAWNVITPVLQRLQNLRMAGCSMQEKGWRPVPACGPAACCAGLQSGAWQRPHRPPASPEPCSAPGCRAVLPAACMADENSAAVCLRSFSCCLQSKSLHSQLSSPWVCM